MNDEMAHGEHMSPVEMLHMQLTPTPTRPATSADSARARAVVAALRSALARYEDPAAAEADGYRLFLPNVKHQRVYHYTHYGRAFKEAFRFDPAQPTSILYRETANGRHVLVGAMYTAPARTSAEELDKRIPLSLARWHEHVNWCVPPRGEESRWTATRGGAPLFGPQSPVATRAACDSVGGVFHERIFGWMVHVNTDAGDDLERVFAH